MTIVFRADASARMGTGHVTRCATLGHALRARRADVRFVCRDHPGNLAASLRDQGFAVSLLPASPAPHDPWREDYASWLGVSQEEDARQTVGALGGVRPDWLVVDHYALGLEWEQRLRPHASKVLAVEDLAGRVHDCDALLDQNFSAEGDGRHAGFVPDGCRLLVGPRYALLAPAYAEHRQRQTPRNGLVRRVLVYFGGADPLNMTGRALTVLSMPAFAHLAVDVVIGANHQSREALHVQAAGRSGTCVYGTRPHLADLMVQADLAIGAGGVTTWERMCLGLPSLVVSVAENQRPTCEALGAAGLIQYVGEASSVGTAQLSDALASLLPDRDHRAQLSSRGQLLVDGRGASRVVDVMFGCSNDELLRIRNVLHAAGAGPAGFDAFTFAWIDRCRADDVLALRNMPHVTEQMRSRDAISAAEHRRFLDDYNHLDRYDFVLVDTRRDRYVGAFYITNLDSCPEIGKYIGDPDYLGKGIAHTAMQRILDFCRSRAGLRRLTAMSRRDNLRNLALNTRLGFMPSGTQGDFVVMALDL